MGINLRTINNLHQSVANVNAKISSEMEKTDQKTLVVDKPAGQINLEIVRSENTTLSSL